MYIFYVYHPHKSQVSCLKEGYWWSTKEEFIGDLFVTIFKLFKDSDVASLWMYIFILFFSYSFDDFFEFTQTLLFMLRIRH